MHLEKIEIHGFKSFADRTILEFPKPHDKRHSVTVVVGPNGSGKSNIADAIKWVLGEQSMKTIRGKRAEDVIFSGTDKRGRLGYAEVSLYLNNKDKAAAIDYDQLVISRRLYRDGNSEYMINKNQVRLFDIQLLLAKAHFGTRSFSIISQGMIDAVLLSTPLERKSFFDEAVGVKEHQIKRHQSLNKLERSEENLHQAGLLLQEISPQLKSLTRQVKKLEQREEIQAGLRNYQQEYYHRVWSELMATKKNQDKIIAELQVQLDEQQMHLKSKRRNLEEIEKSESRSDLFNELQQKLQAKNQERNKLLREMTVLKGRLEVDLEKQGQLNLAWLYRREEEVNTRLIEEQKELTILKSDHNTLVKEQTQKTGELNSLKQGIEEQSEQIERLKIDLEQAASKGPLTLIGRKLKELYLVFQKFGSKLTKANPEDFETLQKQVEMIQAQLNELSDYVAQEMDGISKEADVNISESQELWNLKQELTTLTEQHERLAPDLSGLMVKKQVLEEKTRLKERDIAQLTEELGRVKNDLSTQKAAKNGKIDKSKLVTQQEEMQKQIEAIDTELEKIQLKVSSFNAEEEQKKSRVFALEREYQTVQGQVNTLQNKQHTIQVELARTETKIEDLETEIVKELDEITVVKQRPENTNTDIETLPLDRLFSQIEKFKYQLDLIGGIDPETVTEYKEVKERHDFLSDQLIDLEKTISHLEEVIQELDKTIVKQFDKSFNNINREFERYFQILFGGGRAKLIKILPEEKKEEKSLDEMTDEEKAEAMMAEPKKEEIKSRTKKYRRSDIQGIDIYASPAGKRLSTIAMLSGGERSLTSLALIAAIIHNNPSPFILMDEVDAALDEANSQRMARVLEDLTGLTQFIMITHNRTIMSIADTIYGVTMGADGVSKLLSVKLEDVDKHTTRL
jgi:chromosome segregation protein